MATGTELGIPSRVLAAYQQAAATLAGVDPGCHLGWWDLAAIGQIESGHAGGGRLTVQGVAVPPILGPLLNGGVGTAAVSDTDSGRLDGDAVWDRAVGPMQFLPGTWASYGSGGDPQDVDDATLASGRYLCAGGGDLENPAQLAAAVFSYNHSDSYVADVLAWASAYRHGTPTSAIGPAPEASVDRVLLAAELVPGKDTPRRLAAALVATASADRLAKPSHAGTPTAPGGPSPTVRAAAEPPAASPLMELAQPESAPPAAASPSPSQMAATAHACGPISADVARSLAASEPAPVAGTPSADPSTVSATSTAAVILTVTVLDLVGTEASVSSVSRVTEVDLSGVEVRPANGAVLQVTGTPTGDGTGLTALSAVTC